MPDGPESCGQTILITNKSRSNKHPTSVEYTNNLPELYGAWRGSSRRKRDRDLRTWLTWEYTFFLCLSTLGGIYKWPREYGLLCCGARALSLLVVTGRRLRLALCGGRKGGPPTEWPGIMGVRSTRKKCRVDVCHHSLYAVFSRERDVFVRLWWLGLLYSRDGILNACRHSIVW